MKINHKGYFSAFLSTMLSLTTMTSCKKFVVVPPPPNLVVSNQTFADSADASSAVLGLYIYMVGSARYFGTFNGNITLYTGLSSDELYSTTGNANEIATYQNALSAPSAYTDAFWANSYSLIYQTNAIVEGLSASQTVDIATKNQLIGEAKVVRAFCYFNLANLYGGVPLVTTTNYKETASLPRASLDQIYQQIIADLLSAQSTLPVKYPSQGAVRPNKYTAAAFLARVYLYYKNDWKDAYNQSNTVINSGSYSLEPNLNNVFLAGSSEAIWQLLPVAPGDETAEGNLFVPSDPTVIPNYVISSFLFSAFEAGDQRRNDWLSSNTVGGTTYYYPYKYKLGEDGNQHPIEDYMVFRMGEQYLIRAEAQAEGGGGSLQGAVNDLNVIRHRAGLPNYTGTLDQNSILNSIYHERQVELFCESGHRWYDLKRTGNVNSVMGNPENVCASKGGSWSPDWQLYPIPLGEIKANHSLTQNPGY